MRERRAAVILQRPKQRIGIDLIARPVQVAAAIVAADIVSMRRHRAAVVENVFAQCAGIENRVRDFNIAVGVNAAAGSAGCSLVACGRVAECAVLLLFLFNAGRCFAAGARF